MSKKEKLRLRFLSRPSDLTWDEFVQVMALYGFEEQSNSGSSHRMFMNADKRKISGMVRPHGNKLVKRYLIDEAIEQLRTLGFDI